jgi:hypothetical protein
MFEYGFPLDKGLVRLNTESLLWTIMGDVFIDGHKKISFVDLEKEYAHCNRYKCKNCLSQLFILLQWQKKSLIHPSLDLYIAFYILLNL